MKQPTEDKQPLKNSKSTFRLIKNENGQPPPPRKPKKPIRVVINKELPPAA